MNSANQALAFSMSQMAQPRALHSTLMPQLQGTITNQSDFTLVTESLAAAMSAIDPHRVLPHQMRLDAVKAATEALQAFHTSGAMADAHAWAHMLSSVLEPIVPTLIVEKEDLSDMLIDLLSVLLACRNTTEWLADVKLALLRLAEEFLVQQEERGNGYLSGKSGGNVGMSVGGKIGGKVNGSANGSFGVRFGASEPCAENMALLSLIALVLGGDAGRVAANALVEKPLLMRYLVHAMSVAGASGVGVAAIQTFRRACALHGACASSVLARGGVEMQHIIALLPAKGQRSLASPELLELLTELAADEHLADQMCGPAVLEPIKPALLSGQLTSQLAAVKLMLALQRNSAHGMHALCAEELIAFLLEVCCGCRRQVAASATQGLAERDSGPKKAPLEQVKQLDCAALQLLQLLLAQPHRSAVSCILTRLLAALDLPVQKPNCLLGKGISKYKSEMLALDVDCIEALLSWYVPKQSEQKALLTFCAGATQLLVVDAVQTSVMADWGTMCGCVCVSAQSAQANASGGRDGCKGSLGDGGYGASGGGSDFGSSGNCRDFERDGVPEENRPENETGLEASELILARLLRLVRNVPCVAGDDELIAAKTSAVETIVACVRENGNTSLRGLGGESVKAQIRQLLATAVDGAIGSGSEQCAWRLAPHVLWLLQQGSCEPVPWSATTGGPSVRSPHWGVRAPVQFGAVSTEERSCNAEASQLSLKLLLALKLLPSTYVASLVACPALTEAMCSVQQCVVYLSRPGCSQMPHFVAALELILLYTRLNSAKSKDARGAAEADGTKNFTARSDALQKMAATVPASALHELPAMTMARLASAVIPDLEVQMNGGAFVSSSLGGVGTVLWRLQPCEVLDLPAKVVCYMMRELASEVQYDSTAPGPHLKKLMECLLEAHGPTLSNSDSVDGSTRSVRSQRLQTCFIAAEADGARLLARLLSNELHICLGLPGSRAAVLSLAVVCTGANCACELGSRFTLNTETLRMDMLQQLLREGVEAALHQMLTLSDFGEACFALELLVALRVCDAMGEAETLSAAAANVHSLIAVYERKVKRTEALALVYSLTAGKSTPAQRMNDGAADQSQRQREDVWRLQARFFGYMNVLVNMDAQCVVESFTGGVALLSHAATLSAQTPSKYAIQAAAQLGATVLLSSVLRVVLDRAPTPQSGPQPAAVLQTEVCRAVSASKLLRVAEVAAHQDAMAYHAAAALQLAGLVVKAEGQLKNCETDHLLNMLLGASIRQSEELQAGLLCFLTAISSVDPPRTTCGASNGEVSVTGEASILLSELVNHPWNVFSFEIGSTTLPHASAAFGEMICAYWSFIFEQRPAWTHALPKRKTKMLREVLMYLVQSPLEASQLRLLRALQVLELIAPGSHLHQEAMAVLKTRLQQATAQKYRFAPSEPNTLNTDTRREDEWQNEGDFEQVNGVVVSRWLMSPTTATSRGAAVAPFPHERELHRLAHGESWQTATTRRSNSPPDSKEKRDAANQADRIRKALVILSIDPA